MGGSANARLVVVSIYFLSVWGMVRGEAKREREKGREGEEGRVFEG